MKKKIYTIDERIKSLKTTIKIIELSYTKRWVKIMYFKTRHKAFKELSYLIRLKNELSNDSELYF